MSAQKILISALSGLVAGVAIGLLTAPAAGSETRQKISDTGDELKKKWRRFRGKAADELEELKSVFENEVDGLKEDVRQKVLKLIETSKHSYNNIKQDAATTASES